MSKERNNIEINIRRRIRFKYTTENNFTNVFGFVKEFVFKIQKLVVKRMKSLNNTCNAITCGIYFKKLPRFFCIMKKFNKS